MGKLDELSEIDRDLRDEFDMLQDQNFVHREWRQLDNATRTMTTLAAIKTVLVCNIRSRTHEHLAVEIRAWLLSALLILKVSNKCTFNISSFDAENTLLHKIAASSRNAWRNIDGSKLEGAKDEMR